MGIHLILVLYLSLSMSRRSEKKVSSYFCSIQSYGCRVELFHPLHVSYGGSMHFWGFNCPEGPFTHLRFLHHQQFHNVHNAQWQGFGLALASWQVLDLKDRKLHTLRIEILRNHSSFWNPMGYHGILPKSPGKHRMTSHEIPMKSPGNRNLKVMRLRAWSLCWKLCRREHPQHPSADSLFSWLLFL